MSEISCEEVLIQIEHYLHGELEADSSAHLAEHLSECWTCLDRSEFQRKLREIVRGKCQSETPERLMWRVKVAIRQEKRPSAGSPGA